MCMLSRLGMHLLFYGGTRVKILHHHTVEFFLKDLSIRVSITQRQRANYLIFHSKGKHMILLVL